MIMPMVRADIAQIRASNEGFNALGVKPPLSPLPPSLSPDPIFSRCPSPCSSFLSRWTMQQGGKLASCCSNDMPPQLCSSARLEQWCPLFMLSNSLFLLLYMHPPPPLPHPSFSIHPSTW